MSRYFFKRILLIVPTLLAILVINFTLVHMAPGGPIEAIIAKMQKSDMDEAGAPRASASSGKDPSPQSSANDEMIEKLKKQFHFDQPLLTRFWRMVKSYARLDLGQSYFKGEPVLDLIIQRIPVSISLGLWAMILIYLISIPLGIAKAVRNGSRFDMWTSVAVIVGYAVPSFLFALALVILFAGGSFWSFFPLRGLTSMEWDTFSWWGKIKDYAWHMTLPVAAQVLGGFSALTLLVKNAFLEEVQKTYVVMARSVGMTERGILRKCVFRNAMLILIAGLPASVLSIFLSGSLLIEMIFSLDGMGLLSYEAITNRDYPIIFGSLYLFSLLGLTMHVLSDWLYTRIDPRIHYGAGSA